MRVTDRGLFFIFFAVALLASQTAYGHGWVSDPPSRQDFCATGATPFACGPIQYEPQSVEAPKGSMKCNGGNSRFPILNDDSKPWPRTDVAGTVNITWTLTARHSTRDWDYFVDGKLAKTVPGHGKQPPGHVTHTLTGLSQGDHQILARWNIADTGNAFYSCIDVHVDGQGSQSGGHDDDHGEG